MKTISKKLAAILSTAVISTVSYAQSDAFKMFPVFTDDDFKANIEVAAVAGYIDFDNSAVDDRTVYGIELSFDCPVFTLPGNNPLRQQLSVNHSDQGGFEVTSIEMNPYYFIDVADNLVLGFGPGIGAVHGEPDNGQDQWLFAFQAGAGLKYYMDDFLVGADLRYQWTAEKNFSNVGTQKEDLENMRLLLKAGYRF
jgi:opacity protein-like surface antigen